MSPPVLDRVVKKCLAKDPDGRWHTAHDLHDELQWIAEAGAQVGVPTSPPAVPQPAGWRRAMPLALGMLIIGSLMTGLAVWMLTQPASPPITRFSVVLPPDQQLTNRPWRNVALSPDGTHLAYVANQQLYLRAMDQLQATPLRGTDGGSGPFFSPDGQSIGFAQDGQLKRVAITGGAPIVLCDVPRSLAWGASWGREDTILFGQSDQGVLQVSGAGGTAEVLIAVEGGQAARQPQMLPGGETVLFTLGPVGNWALGQIVAQSLQTGVVPAR